MKRIHISAGAVFGAVHGVRIPRHYGAPDEEYRRASEAWAVMDRSYRTRLAITGRAPGQMLQGVITGRVPGPHPSVESGVGRASVSYSTILTPKGKMVTDLRVFRWPSTAETFLLDLPPAGAGPASAHLAKVLPPRLARTKNVSGDFVMLTVAGPEASTEVRSLLDSWGFGDVDPAALEEGDQVWALGSAAPDPGSLVDAFVLAPTSEVAVPAFDLIVPAGEAESLWQDLTDAGATPMGHAVWETLRVEAGRPDFGSDMDEKTIPIEAGIDSRAIDHAKGCYTGQEVIVRIRDRGHVNRHLRGLLLGDVPAPAPGTDLFVQNGDKVVGTVTSAVESPSRGQAIALGYVRREVEPGSTVRIGAPDGTAAQVVALGSAGWEA